MRCVTRDAGMRQINHMVKNQVVLHAASALRNKDRLKFAIATKGDKTLLNTQFDFTSVRAVCVCVWYSLARCSDARRDADRQARECQRILRPHRKPVGDRLARVWYVLIRVFRCLARGDAS